jgi:hypothetical protein
MGTPSLQPRPTRRLFVRSSHGCQLARSKWPLRSGSAQCLVVPRASTAMHPESVSVPGTRVRGEWKFNFQDVLEHPGSLGKGSERPLNLSCVSDAVLTRGRCTETKLWLIFIRKPLARSMTAAQARKQSESTRTRS